MWEKVRGEGARRKEKERDGEARKRIIDCPCNAALEFLYALFAHTLAYIQFTFRYRMVIQLIAIISILISRREISVAVLARLPQSADSNRTVEKEKENNKKESERGSERERERGNNDLPRSK